MASKTWKESGALTDLFYGFELFVARESNVFMEDPAITRLDGTYRVVIENRADKSDNSWIHIHDTSTSLLVGANGPLGMYSHCFEPRGIDLQEIVNLEGLSAMRELAATYAHEIKNPLFSIRGFVQLLEKSFNEGDKRKEYTDIVIKELDRLQRIIAQFLTLSRSKMVEEVCGQTSYVLQDITRDVIKLFQGVLEMKKISYFCNFSDEPIRISINCDYIMQILINLMQNSIDSMNENKSLYIDLDADENKVYITLRDEGTGIKEENLRKIFYPFFSTKEAGTGLGLYITKQIIENCGGSISVNSIYNEGTTFMIELPKE